LLGNDMTLLVVDDLFRFYHPGDAEVRALRGASLVVRRGETVALEGPSGSGKSTLLACIAGLDEPDGGTVTVSGRRMTRRPEAERSALRAECIGFLAQSDNLFAHLTVAENIAIQIELCGLQVGAARISELLRLVELSERGDALPARLSGGESARAGLAVALAGNPALLIADEPTAEVDGETEARILDVLEQRRLNGGAALIATHSRSLSQRASRVLAIADGRIADAVAPGRPEFSPKPGVSATRAPQALMIQARGASRSFTLAGCAIAAVRPVDCAIYATQRLAIIGPSGSGKSTLLNMLAGLEDVSEGGVTWPGLDPTRPLRPQQIGVVFQAPSLIPSLTVLENVRLPLEICGRGRGAAMAADEALDRLSLMDLRDKLPDQLSGGQMQRVAIARAMVVRPKILFADEPTGQLDHATGRAVLQALLDGLTGSDTALVVATHDPDIARLMEECWRMDAGVLTQHHSWSAAA
jgi:ABC-type lipoprotein export system ATPase subunit